MAVRYRLGCDLAHEVQQETVFIFNVEVARLGRHRDLAETLTTSVDLPREVYETPNVRNRYLKLIVPAGAFELLLGGGDARRAA